MFPSSGFERILHEVAWTSPCLDKVPKHDIYINMVVDHGRKQQKTYNKHKKKHIFTTKTRINTSPSRGGHIRNPLKPQNNRLCFTSSFPKNKVVPRIRIPPGDSCLHHRSQPASAHKSGEFLHIFALNSKVAG